MTSSPTSGCFGDRKILRELACRVRVAADEPVMEQRRAQWRDHNALRPRKPMVLCFPEGAWVEILPDSALTCTEKSHRDIERTLRSKLFWWEHINDDNTLEPWFDLCPRVQIGDFGVEIPLHHGDDRGSYVWDAPIKDMQRDLDKLHFRALSVDRAGTKSDLDRVNELFGDILPVRIRGGFWWTLGLTQSAAFLIGMENLMWAMCDQPDHLHRLMAFLRDEAMHFIDWCEAEQVLSPNTGGNDYVGSGGVGCIDGVYSPQLGPVKLSQRWGFAESQETVGVSPAMFEEFVLPYQLPLLEKFALNCYGCCEGLEHRIDLLIKQVPRLRRVSVAPNANQELLSEKLAGKYVFSRKPYPAHVSVGFNEHAIRDDLRHTLSVAGDQPLELIMKDTHTVQHEPNRFTRWVEIARDEIERYQSSH